MQDSHDHRDQLTAETRERFEQSAEEPAEQSEYLEHGHSLEACLEVSHGLRMVQRQGQAVIPAERQLPRLASALHSSQLEAFQSSQPASPSRLLESCGVIPSRSHVSRDPAHRLVAHYVPLVQCRPHSWVEMRDRKV